VALNVRTPEPQNLSQKYAQLQALKNADQQTAMQQQQFAMQQQEAPLRMAALQQQTQQGQLGLQQAQRTQQDDQSFRAAMQDPSLQGKTVGEIADTLAKTGHISQAGWAQAKKADLESRTALAGLDEKTLKNQKDAHALTQELYNNVMSMPDDKLAANWSQIAQQYDAIPGNNKQPLDPNKPLTKQELAQFGPALSMGNAYFDQELERRGKIADTGKKEQELQYGPTGPAAEAKYRFILSKQSSGKPLTADELSFAKGFEASNAKSTTASDSLGISSVSTNRPSGLAMTGRGGGGAAPPAGVPVAQGGMSNAPLTGTNLPSSSASSPANAKQSIVDMIGQYKMNPTLVGRAFLKHPELVGMVGEKYPNWDQTAYNAKNKIVESMTSGPESRPINAIGTALGHANELRDAIDALGNGDAGLKTLRSLGNKYGIETGDDKATAFNLIIHRLAPELTAAYVQGGGGEGERAAAAEDFSPSMSRQQLLTNWSKSVQLLRSKISQDEQQWNTTYQPTKPEDAFTTRFLGAPAKQALQRWSNETGNPSGLAGSAPAPAAPHSHAFSLGAWQKANPQGDPKAAVKAAQAAGYQVTQ
jgi:hypothetical protein